MQRVTFTSSLGETIELYQSPFFLNEIEGLGDVSAEIHSQKSPGQNGSMAIDYLLEERYIPIEVIILKDLEANRELISRVFNPNLGPGRLTYQNNIVRREITAISEHVPKFPDERPRLGQKAMIDLVCNNPYWEDHILNNVKLEDFVSSFSFPFSFPVSFAIRGDMRTLLNEGHVPTPIKVTFIGEAVNPKITNLTTGEFIRINRTIPKDYKLVITTDVNHKSVKIIAPDGIETNAMGYIDLDSDFFSLDVGNNQLSFITDGGTPEVYIEYRNLYVGV